MPRPLEYAHTMRLRALLLDQRERRGWSAACTSVTADTNEAQQDLDQGAHAAEGQEDRAAGKASW
ncbi:hypothetical protein [Nonomuraea monospora]|uniref:hypothetical protein n=1 Tax=Nonomuraea monospora TaxID=568818 RepID=UPI0031D5BCEB